MAHPKPTNALGPTGHAPSSAAPKGRGPSPAHPLDRRRPLAESAPPIPRRSAATAPRSLAMPTTSPVTRITPKVKRSTSQTVSVAATRGPAASWRSGTLRPPTSPASARKATASPPRTFQPTTMMSRSSCTNQQLASAEAALRGAFPKWAVRQRGESHGHRHHHGPEPWLATQCVLGVGTPLAAREVPQATYGRSAPTILSNHVAAALISTSNGLPTGLSGWSSSVA